MRGVNSQRPTVFSRAIIAFTSTIRFGFSSASTSFEQKDRENNACDQEQNASDEHDTIGIGKGKRDRTTAHTGGQKGRKEHSLWIEIIQKKICSS
jgi:hypothetical protein